MENQRCEHLIHRIISGSFKSKYGYLKAPNKYTLYEAALLEDEILSLCKNEVFDDTDILSLLMNYNLWTSEDEELIKGDDGLVKQIEDKKILIFEKFEDYNLRLKLMKELSGIQSKFYEMLNRRHQFDYLTDLGISSLSKNLYIVEKSSDSEYPHLLFNDLQNNSVTEKEIRFLARNEPWTSYYSTDITFDNFPLTDEQNRLLLWTKLYHNLKDQEDCPSDEVMDCDEALDGYLIRKRREAKKSKGVKEIEKIKISNPKISRAHEVFVVAQSPREAKLIEEMNPIASKLIKESRLNQVRRNKTMNFGEFKDVQTELRMELNKVKNGK